MAHYAFLDWENKVIEIIKGKDEGTDDKNWELIYQAQRGCVCKRTSKNTFEGVHINPDTGMVSEDQSKSFRKNYAKIGGSYDSARDAFLPPKPFASWIIDEDKCIWKAPIDKPEDNIAEGYIYNWNEENGSWEKISF